MQDINDNFLDITSNVDYNKYADFTEKSEANYELNIDEHSLDFDYTWIDRIEETLEYLDNVIRDPKRFLAQEEEIVPVEKAKKISMETIKHLAQHTNLIQEVSADGRITPSAVLNIHREETFELYENRFINSLLSNLYIFIRQRKKDISEGSFSKSKKKLVYKAETSLKSEKINITLNVDIDAFEENLGVDSSGLTYSERIEKIELIILDFMKTPLIKSLLNAPPVRSPIRKTNAILKNTNFNKALELWEYIERYDIKDRKEVKDSRNITKDEGLESKLLQTYFLNYNIIQNIIKKIDEESKNIDINSEDDEFNKLIIDFLKENKHLDTKELRAILLDTLKKYNKLKELKKRRIQREITRCFDSFFSRVSKIKDI